MKDGNAGHITREPEQVKAFRDTWRDGIHSYLTYLRDRLTVARDLLTDSGSIFVQIGDENVHRVRAVLDEVFGDDNFVGNVHCQKDHKSTRRSCSAQPATSFCGIAKKREVRRSVANAMARQCAAMTRRNDYVAVTDGDVTTKCPSWAESQVPRTPAGTGRPHELFQVGCGPSVPSWERDFRRPLELGLTRAAKADRLAANRGQTTLRYRTFS